MILDLLEQDLSNTSLKVNDTTQSHLRLKTLSGFGLFGTYGAEVENLTYTLSFSGYTKDSIVNRTLPPIQAGT